MIALTDLALFDKLTEIIGTNTGVFCPEVEAFRMAKAKYGSLELPIFSLDWTTLNREDVRHNRPMGNRGLHYYLNDTLTDGKEIKSIPVAINYDFHVWTIDKLDLINIFRDVFFYSVEGGGNGITLDYPELFDQPLGVQLSMDLNMSTDKSTETDTGKYYHGTMPIIAHSFYTKGTDKAAINKIVATLYSTEVEDIDTATPDNSEKIADIEILAEE